MRTYGAEGHFCTCTQGHGAAECTKQGRAAVVVSVVPCAIHTALVTTLPISSATLSHMPVCHNCGLIPSFSIFSFSNPPSSFLLPVFPLCRYELLILYLPAFFSLLPSFFPAPLLQSVSLFCPRLFPSSLSLFPSASLSSAASMFLCVNSWDAFVEGFHSDGPIEQVVIHVCSL